MDVEEMISAPTLSDVRDSGLSLVPPPPQPLSSLMSPPTTALPHQVVDNVQMDIDVTILAPLE